MTKSKLNAQLVQQFASLAQMDWVPVGPQTTMGQVLMQSVESQLQSQPLTDVQKNYRKVYEEKLKQKAEQEGFKSVDEMLAAKRQEQPKKPIKEPKEPKGKPNAFAKVKALT